MSNRKYIKKHIKSFVYNRQHGRCNSCFCDLEITSHLDHIRPLWACGASTDVNNLQYLCCNCHARKTLIETKMMPTKIPQSSFLYCKACKQVISMYFTHNCPEWENVTDYDQPFYLSL